MKRIGTILSIPLIALLCLTALLAPLAHADVSYDSTETAVKNLFDALAQMANADNAFVYDVLWVDGDRTDDYTADGSLAAPYKTITAANTAAVSGDVLLVAPGAYAETVTITSGAHLFGWNVTGATLTGDYILFNGSTLAIEGAPITINDQSDDLDIRIESDGNANAIVLDAGNDRIGLFTASPTVPVEITGEVKITGATTLDGATVINESGADADFTVESDNVTDALKVDAGTDAVQLGAFTDFEIIEADAASYSISSTSRAGYVLSTYTDTGAQYLHFMSSLVAAGRRLVIVDGDANAGSNNIQVDTEAAEKINGADTYTLDADGEHASCLSDGTDWHCY